MSLPSLRQNDILLSGLLSLMIKLGTDETIDLCGKNFPLRHNKPDDTIICNGNPSNHPSILQPLTTYSGGGGVAETAGAPGLVSDTRDRPVPGL